MPEVVLTDGVKIYYYESRPAGKVKLVCLHGSGGNGRHWLYQLRGLDPGIHALAPDLPGHGRSSGRAMDTVEGYREAVRQFIAALKLAPCILAGHSLGGAITLDYARVYPGDLMAMIIVGSGARLRVLPSLLDTFRSGQSSADMHKYLYSDRADPALVEEGAKEIRQISPHIFAADLTACNRFDLMNELSSINVPALVISADEDRLTPVKYGAYLVEELPRAELAVIEGAGHMMMLEKPAAVNKQINTFIKNLGTL